MDKRSKLPLWIGNNMREANVNISTDVALSTAKKFLRQMAQPYEITQKVGASLWSLADIDKRYPQNLPQSMDVDQK